MSSLPVRPVVVVPVKRLADAKSRLASELDEAARNELVVAMLEDLLTALREVYDGPVMLVSPEDEYVRVASRFEAVWERDAGEGYNEAMRHAARTEQVREAGAMLILPADLPGARSSDIARCIEALGDSQVVVASAVDGGTAALGLRPAQVIAPAFGPQSADRHREAALAASVSLTVLDAPSLAHDIDTLAMLSDAPAEFTPGPATTRFIERHREQLGHAHGEEATMTSEALERAIRGRRSIRGLEGPPLSENDVRGLVELALLAPAPHHTRPWRFALVAAERREALANAMGEAWRADMERDGVPEVQQERALARSRRQIVEAPTLLLGCVVGEGLRVYPDERRDRAEWTLAAHSFGAGMQNILLAASARGFGAFWISAPLYAQEAVRRALDLDESWVPQACIALGHPNPDYRPFDRPSPDLGASFVIR